MSELPPLPRLPIWVPHFCDGLLGLFCPLHCKGAGDGGQSPAEGWSLARETCLHNWQPILRLQESDTKTHHERHFYKMTVLLLRKFKLTEWNRESEISVSPRKRNPNILLSVRLKQEMVLFNNPLKHKFTTCVSRGRLDSLQESSDPARWENKRKKEKWNKRSHYKLATLK